MRRATAAARFEEATLAAYKRVARIHDAPHVGVASLLQHALEEPNVRRLVVDDEDARIQARTPRAAGS